ncbi:MAG: carboxypeptidase regulatory-like domain-containing protein [Betaproteobacteria bacterium]|nr:carboxypeptidase regulatory-like domain-containing protein [Betaproteobacteria bacterium]
MMKGLSMLIATLFTVGVAHAAVESAPLPHTRTQGDVTWLSGGIGQSEARAMERAARHYPLSLEFVVKTEHKGMPPEFTANVPVTITNVHGAKVFSAMSTGPFMLLKLPAGRYRVVAEVHGKKLERQVVVGRRPHHVVFEALS